MKAALVGMLALASLQGCGLVPPNMGAMSAEQINAATKDKSSAAGCTQYTGTGGQFTALFVNNDKTFGTAGGKTTIKCGAGEVTFEDAGKAAREAAREAAHAK